MKIKTEIILILTFSTMVLLLLLLLSAPAKAQRAMPPRVEAYIVWDIDSDLALNMFPSDQVRAGIDIKGEDQ